MLINKWGAMFWMVSNFRAVVDADEMQTSAQYIQIPELFLWLPGNDSLDAVYLASEISYLYIWFSRIAG